MELAWSVFLWSSICISVVLLLQYLRTEKARNNATSLLPPGPRRWPVVGNMFDLAGEFPHQTLAKLAPKYGAVMSLQIGAVTNVIIQSTKASKEMFKNHDLIYSGRTITEAMKACGYYQGSMAVAQYGPYWRTMKRLCTTELGIIKRVNETIPLRKKNIDKMLQWIDEEAQARGGGVHVARFVFLMNFNLLGNILVSRDLFDPQSKDASEFYERVDGITKWAGQPNLADFFPFLKWLDPQRIQSKVGQEMKGALQIVSGFVKERIEDRRSGKQRQRTDFLDVLLNYEGEGEGEPDKLSEIQLTIFILELFMGGTETTSNTTEWAMAELLRNTDTMSKVKTELAQVVGESRRIEESDIEKLPYLQAVVKETLRLHPPIPFLVPRKATKDNDFMGYHIPKDTQVLVNAWAIGRDPDSWVDPLSFKPERFLGSETDYRGQHFEFIPFGAGRRICPGITLSSKVLPLSLGSLIHCFDWELEPSVSPYRLDMKERLGFTLRKDVPLKAIPKRTNVYK